MPTDPKRRPTLVRCPKCGATPGNVCRGADGHHLLYPHVERRAAAREQAGKAAP